MPNCRAWRSRSDQGQSRRAHGAGHRAIRQSKSGIRDFAMMYYLHQLSSQFIGFNVFLYVTFRAIAAAVTAFLTTLIFGNFIIAKLRALKVEQPIRGAAEVHRLSETERGKKRQPTTGGGLGVGAGLWW